MHSRCLSPSRRKLPPKLGPWRSVPGEADRKQEPQRRGKQRSSWRKLRCRQVASFARSSGGRAAHLFACEETAKSNGARALAAVEASTSLCRERTAAGRFRSEPRSGALCLECSLGCTSPCCPMVQVSQRSATRSFMYIACRPHENLIAQPLERSRAADRGAGSERCA